MPGELIVKRQLIDLPGSRKPECRGRDVEMGYCPSRELLQPGLKLVGDGNLHRIDIGIADYGDVAAFGGAFGARGFSVCEAQTVGAGNGPEIEKIRMADLRVGSSDESHLGNKAKGMDSVGERPRTNQAEIRLPGDCNQDQPGDEQQHIPADQLQHAADA